MAHVVVVSGRQRLLLAQSRLKKRTFHKFSYRGVDLEALLDKPSDDLVQLFSAGAGRRFDRGLKR